ncbi:MAG TPA: alpha-amylase family glycosyl hydrolase [Propionibacteriaceae bacterium]|nr:alpha-amylase family glycosyl hydrolase [Propionibacteriaceae bacterium]
MGNEDQFKRMVRKCREAGVKVYVDALINHMTGQGNTSYGGVDYKPYNYPDYGPNDFHFKTGECPSSDGGIQDFNNKLQVFKCNLVGLEDLRTETDKVQGQLAAYLNKLIGYGVSGFRVDAAKHVGQDDLDAIYSRLHKTKDGVKPYWALEVFGGGPGILSPEAFTRSGDVLGLDAAKQIQAAFKSYQGSGNTGSLATLDVFGKGSGLTSSRKTMSFVTNHDTDRNAGEYLGHKDGSTFILANEWLLASGYGSPQVFSSFEWETRDDSPPANKNGRITDAECTSGAWTCDHRNRGIVAMVKWHNYVGNAKRANFYTDDANVVAFSKDSEGWAAFNNGTSAKEIRVQTGLPRGTYCDVIHDTNPGSPCARPTVVVNSTGLATVTVGAKDAVVAVGYVSSQHSHITTAASESASLSASLRCEARNVPARQHAKRRRDLLRRLWCWTNF